MDIGSVESILIWNNYEVSNKIIHVNEIGLTLVQTHELISLLNHALTAVTVFEDI
jgi:hypothetical protein